MAENVNQTIKNLKSSSKGFDENMNAAKENFLFKGYYKRKEKAAEKIKVEAIEKKAAEKKKNDADEKKAAKQKVKDEKK
jgi:phospholipid/cholesterol/gamma-HCH transport system substrate-binding protein